MEKTVTLEQFNRLSTPEQYYILEQYGQYLEAFTIEGPFKVCLFEISYPGCNYYCSVYYNMQRDRLIKVKAFTNYSRLDKFIKIIDLAPIFSLL
jgi:hypothetical protein